MLYVCLSRRIASTASCPNMQTRGPSCTSLHQSNILGIRGKDYLCACKRLACFAQWLVYILTIIGSHAQASLWLTIPLTRSLMAISIQSFRPLDIFTKAHLIVSYGSNYFSSSLTQPLVAPTMPWSFRYFHSNIYPMKTPTIARIQSKLIESFQSQQILILNHWQLSSHHEGSLISKLG